jgi:hypothetical protein
MDQCRVIPLQRLIGKTECCHHPGPEVLEDHVGAGDEGEQSALVLVMTKVESYTALVAIDAQEVDAFAVVEGTPCAHHIAVGELLHLDDVRTEVAEERRTERAGQRPGQI